MMLLRALLFLLCIILANSSWSGEESVVRSARPDRSITWSNHHDVLFKEYYISGQNNNCAFYAFDTTREQGIDAILNKIKSKSQSTIKLVAQSIYSKSWVLDVAEMIMKVDYRPSDMGHQSAERYVKHLLDHIETIQDNAVVKVHRSRNPIHLHNHKEIRDLSHPQFLSGRKTKERLEKLKHHIDRGSSYGSHRRDELPARTTPLRSLTQDDRGVRRKSSRREQPSRYARSLTRDKHEEVEEDILTSPPHNLDSHKRLREERIPFRGTTRPRIIPDSPRSSPQSLFSVEGVEEEIEEETSPLSSEWRGESDREDETELGHPKHHDDLSSYELESWLPQQRQNLLKCRYLMMQGEIHTFDEAVLYFRQAYDLARKIGAKELESRSLLGLGKCRYNDETMTTFDCFHQSLKIAQEIGHSFIESLAYIGLGNQLIGSSQWGQRQSYYRQALEVGQRICNPYLQARALIALGSMGGIIKDQASIDYLRQGLKIAQDRGYLKLQAQALISLGNTLHDDNQAQWYREALEIARGIEDQTLQAQALIGLGNARYEEGDHSRTSWYREALGIARGIEDQTLQAQALIGLGNARYEEGDHSRASWYREALKIAGLIQSPKLQVKALYGLGNIYLCDKKCPEKALPFYNQALKLVDSQDEQNRIKSKINQANYWLSKSKGGNRGENSSRNHRQEKPSFSREHHSDRNTHRDRHDSRRR